MHGPQDVVEEERTNLCKKLCLPPSTPFIDCLPGARHICSIGSFVHHWQTMSSWTIAFLDPCRCSAFACSSLLAICSVAPLEERRKSGWISTEAYRKCSGLFPLCAIFCRTLQRYQFAGCLHLLFFGTENFGLCLTNMMMMLMPPMPRQ